MQIFIAEIVNDEDIYAELSSSPNICEDDKINEYSPEIRTRLCTNESGLLSGNRFLNLEKESFNSTGDKRYVLSNSPLRNRIISPVKQHHTNPLKTVSNVIKLTS